VPFAPLPLLLLAVALGLLLVFVQVGALRIAFDKLGLSPQAALALLLVSLAGSLVNVPLFTLRAETAVTGPVPWMFRGLLRPPLRPPTGRTLIAVNVGGCLVPLGICAWLLRRHGLPVGEVLLAVATVALLARVLSRPIPGVGIGMPLFVAPLAAAVVALLIDPAASAPLAYVAGTVGVLLGADLSRLNDIRRLGTPFASIGGAGTFDGIFLTGIVAVLIA
jgi:uncharacterized membrane protein